MTNYQGIFERYETKYMLDARQYQAVLARLEGPMERDDYGLHTICSLYFDTEDFQLARASLDKPVYKEKLRLRSYGVPGKDSTVFLELKKKFRGVVYKRRVPMTLEEASAYFALGERPSSDGQILREIDWLVDRRQPTPKALIAYDRLALADREDSGLRVTFDAAIRWRSHSLDLTFGDWGSLLLGRGQVLMEIKIPGTMPLWLARLLDELALYPTSFSKYGTCYQNHLLGTAGRFGGMICA